LAWVAARVLPELFPLRVTAVAGVASVKDFYNRFVFVLIVREYEKNDSNLVGVEQIAEDFGVSIRQVQLFVKQGLPRAAHGQYDELACLQCYKQRLELKIAAKYGMEYFRKYYE
jgi:hypothetical protein